MDSEPPSTGGANRLKLNVKFGGQLIPVELAPNSTIKELKVLLQTRTNILPRGQKLISKGKVLLDELTLASLEINDRSKIMLIALPRQGDRQMITEPEILSPAKAVRAMERGNIEMSEAVTKSRLERWKCTGVVALAERGLTAIPEKAWTSISFARVLDVRDNSLLEVPAAIGHFSFIQKLLLNGNRLSENSIAWDQLTSLKHLAVLNLNQNNLTAVPSAIGALTCLKQLLISSNNLVSLPTEIGFLTELQVIKAQNNRLKTIPTSIGGCVSLVEVDLSCNLLTELPETFGNLKNLKALYLSNNGLKFLPNTLFKMCLQLSTLDLHETEITMDLLRQFEGWESFDERRRLKHQKQLDFRVSGAGEFDEGADKNL